jgi:Common central domain of tyrosinase
LQAHSRTRRSILLGTGVMTAAATLKLIVPGTLRAGETQKRKNIDALSAPELDAYERAIQTVKTRSTANPTDPTGYLYWANLHNDFDTVQHSGCAHFSEKFLPWHRRHLVDFEKVLQQTIPGVTDNLMIPYWDWTKPPTGTHFPKAFEREASSLFDRRFNISPPPWGADDIHGLVKEPDWSIFGGLPDPSDGFGENPGSLEFGPHNTLHTNISRDMRNPPTAALDPIFWSFHAFIDVVWTRWQRLHVTDQSPQPFRDENAIIWFRDRSFTVKTTAKTSDFNYEYDYDYATADGPVALPTAAAAAPTVSVYLPATRTVPLAAASEAGRYLTLRPAGPITSPANAVIRIANVPVFHEQSYRLDIYLHPANIDVASINSQARRPLLIRTVTLWKAHHDGKVQLHIRLSPAQVAQLNGGSVVTIASQLALAAEDIPTTAQPTAFSLPKTSSLVQQAEVQER